MSNHDVTTMSYHVSTAEILADVGLEQATYIDVRLARMHTQHMTF